MKDNSLVSYIEKATPICRVVSNMIFLGSLTLYITGMTYAFLEFYFGDGSQVSARKIILFFIFMLISYACKKEYEYDVN